jgi:hypothetical protein
MTKLEAFTKYMSQFAAHRGADMEWVMKQSSHGRIFEHAWDEATKAEREACAQVCEQAGVDGLGTLAAAAMVRGRK